MSSNGIAINNHYRCFGLSIGSEIPIVELVPTQPAEPDVILTCGKVERPMPEFPIGRAHEFGDHEDYLGIAMVGQYLINDDHILFDQAPELPESFIGFSLLGPVMAALMHRRGHLVLHGSALVIDGRAVVFLGDKGAGKSTTAGAMVAAGFRLVSDDVIAIASDHEQRPLVTPAFPMVKLSNEALEVFGRDSFTSVPNPTDHMIKSRLIVKGGIPSAPVPVGAVYELRRGSADASMEIDSLGPASSLQLLLTHSYMARYGRDAFQRPGAMVAHLSQCGELAGRIRVARLTIPDELSRLNEVAVRIQADLSGHAK